MNFRKFSSFSKCVILNIPKPWKFPKENYVEPAVWHLKFDQPSQVRPRCFFDCPKNLKLGPSKDVGKCKTYRNPEYYSYHTFSYYNMEEDLNCKRCSPQPSPFNKEPVCSTEKCP